MVRLQSSVKPKVLDGVRQGNRCTTYRYRVREGVGERSMVSDRGTDALPTVTESGKE